MITRREGLRANQARQVFDFLNLEITKFVSLKKKILEDKISLNVIILRRMHCITMKNALLTQLAKSRRIFITFDENLYQRYRKMELIFL